MYAKYSLIVPSPSRKEQARKEEPLRERGGGKATLIEKY